MITTSFQRRLLKAAVASSAALFTTMTLTTVPAHAAEGSVTGSSSTTRRVEAGDEDPFYDTSNLTPGNPGDILRSQQAPISDTLPGLRFNLPKNATKVVYTTTLADGTSVPVSGYMVEPTTEWTGKGERPTVVVGRGTVGQGDQCAPSRQWPLDGQPDPFASGRLVNLEGLYDGIFSTQGVRVFVTDYVGMGTPGMHTYMNREEQAHAMLDGARAARNLVEENGGVFGKVGFYGHSQGGGASAAAAEEAGNYAPDLNVAGAYASAPPADLDAVQKNIDGSDLVGAIGFSINGLVERYPELDKLLNQHLSEDGKKTLENLSTMCTDEITEEYGYQKTSDWTKDGRTLDELLVDLPEGKRAMDEQRIGDAKPSAPVMIVSGRHDLNVEYQQAKDLARKWCTAGASVTYRDDFMPPIGEYNHFVQAVTGGPFGVTFLIDRFNGVPVSDECSGFDGQNDLQGSAEGSAAGSSLLAGSSGATGSSKR